MTRRLASACATFLLVVGTPAVAFVTLTSAPAGADDFGPVNPAIPDGDTDSLRDILENQIVDGDTVLLESGATYTLDFCEELPSAAALTTGDIGIIASVTIVGNGATILQTCPNRVLDTDFDLTASNVTITGGREESDGGGIQADGTLVLDGVTLVDNQAEGHGGGVFALGPATVTGSTFTNNVADANVGGFGGGGGLFAASTLTLSGSTFSDNVTTGTGFGSCGGGLTVGDTATVSTSSFFGNRSLRAVGGAICITEGVGDLAAAGGVSAAAAGEVTIDSSTIAQNNLAPAGGAIGNEVDGASVTITNSTITGNTSGIDGAIAMSSADEDEPNVATLTLVNDTITDNVLGEIEAPEGDATALDAGARPSGGPSASALEVEATTLSIVGTFRPFGTVITGDGLFANCAIIDPSESQGYNYSDDDTCGFGASTDQQNAADPQLGALAANGGPTLTQLPELTSPLLNAIPAASCAVFVDQRGVTRPRGAGCDIGSVELEVLEELAVEVTPRLAG